jgi:hypothetical protein
MAMEAGGQFGCWVPANMELEGEGHNRLLDLIYGILHSEQVSLLLYKRLPVTDLRR